MLPLLLLGALVLLQFATLASDQVAAQALAADAARAVAAGVPEQVVAASPELAARGARLRVTRRRVPGDPAAWVVAEVRVDSRAFRRLGLALEPVGAAAARAQ